MNRSEADNVLEGPFAMLTLGIITGAELDRKMRWAVAQCREGGVDDATIVELIQSNSVLYGIAPGSMPMDEWVVGT